MGPGLRRDDPLSDFVQALAPKCSVDAQPILSAYSQFSAPPFWYSITRVSKKFFSFLRSMASDIHGNGFSVSSNTRESPNWAQRRLAMFRWGVEWMHKLPYVLPATFVIVFWNTVGAVLVGRTDWVLPASFLLGGVAIGMNWMSLRNKGLPITARLSDMTDTEPLNRQTGWKRNAT
jgi:hypothetical protein